jgi:rubrerythrin
MATFKCTKCGFEKESRCKPQNCPNCGEKKSFEKDEAKK